MSYTKGKWYRFGGMMDGYGVAIETETGRQEICPQKLNCDTAGLIAAAPQLLDACRRCVEEGESLEIYRIMQAAIAEAEKE